MIAIEQTPSSGYKVYSTDGFYIKQNDILYTEVYVASEQAAENITETRIAIPAPVAAPAYVYDSYFNENRSISQTEITESREYILKAFKALPLRELYYVWFFFPEWSYSTEYVKDDILIYDNELYYVTQSHIAVEPPSDSSNYQRIERPEDKIIEWNTETSTRFFKGQRTRIGTHIYESLIDNNTWSPMDFPAAWKLIS